MMESIETAVIRDQIGRKKTMMFASSVPTTLSSLSTAILHPRHEHHTDSLNSAMRIAVQAPPNKTSDVPFVDDVTGDDDDDPDNIEPPVTLNDHTKDHLLRSVFHVSDYDTTTMRRSASPSEDYDLASAPMTSLSAQMLQREYDRDTWLMFLRHRARYGSSTGGAPGASAATRRGHPRTSLHANDGSLHRPASQSLPSSAAPELWNESKNDETNDQGSSLSRPVMSHVSIITKVVEDLVDFDNDEEDEQDDDDDVIFELELE